MAKIIKVTNDDLKAVDAVRKAMGAVTAKDAVSRAKAIGNVPTAGGIQRELMTLFHTVGAASNGKGYDIKAAFAAWVESYYDKNVVNARTKPKASSLATIRQSYQKFADLGALPYDSWPIAQRAMADRNLSLSGRAAKVEKMRAAHPESAPTQAELTAGFEIKPPKEGKKNVDAGMKAICSAIEGKVNDDEFMTALADSSAVKAVRFRALAEAAMLLRLSVTKDDDKAKAETANKALLAKLASLPTAGKNAKGLH